MAEPTFLLMHSETPFEQMPDDDRILIGGLQERGYTVQRLHVPRVAVLAEPVPTAVENAAMAKLRTALRDTTWRLNGSTGVVALFGTADAVVACMHRQYACGVTYLLLIAAALVWRFVLLPRRSEVA